MIPIQDVQGFAQEWIDAWNSHDLDRILSHYADDFQMISPFIMQLMNEPTGMIQRECQGLLGQGLGTILRFAY